MRITVLGSGTSTGIPLVACSCPVCQSTNPYNKRYRSSVLIETNDGTCILIDTTPDLRTQALNAKMTKVHTVLYTHTHADHILGIDDLRAFNFAMKRPIPIYANQQSSDYIKKSFSYTLKELVNYPGGAPPKLLLNTIEPYEPISIRNENSNKEHKVIPLLAFHGQLEVLGYRIHNFAYITDCSRIPDKTISMLNNLDCLILDGLRERPHKTHLTLSQAIKIMEIVKPKKGYLTHISHETDHDEGNELIKNSTPLNIELAFDGLVIDLYTQPHSFLQKNE